MQNSTNALRAPAETPKIGVWPMFAAALTWLLQQVIGCCHRHTTLPYNDRQTCLDCGQSRLYLFHTDFEHAGAGIFIGKWRKPVFPQSAHRVIAKTLVANAIAPVNGLTAILNPGGENDLFKPRSRKAVQG